MHGPTTRRNRRLLLLLEYTVVFLAVPAFLALRNRPIPLFASLWALAALCLGYLLTRRDFDRSRLWNAGPLRPWIRAVWLPFVLVAPLLALWAAFAEPRLFLRFVRGRPGPWALVMILYPVLSAYPQGIIFCSRGILNFFSVIVFSPNAQDSRRGAAPFGSSGGWAFSIAFTRMVPAVPRACYKLRQTSRRCSIPVCRPALQSTGE